jgi:inorganic triphosphatase YgiF
VDPAATSNVERRFRILSARDDADAQLQRPVYFDTPEFDLERAGILLRVRQIGHQRIRTIKVSKPDSPFDRNEFENEIVTTHPDWNVVDDTPVALLLTDRIRRRLGPLFHTEVQRSVRSHLENGSRIDMVLDRGRIIARNRSASINEVELELRSGEAKTFYANRLAQSAVATAEQRRDAGRWAYALL